MGIDYYLVPGGVLIEEFVRDRDYSARGLCGAVWTADEPGWRGASAYSRALRTDPALLARVEPTDRAGAEAALPGLAAEDELRTHFLDYEPFATAPPLRLGAGEGRFYRVLFVKEPRGPFPDGHRAVGGDHFSWTLRRVAGGFGWGLDVTVRLGSDSDATVGPVIDELTAALLGRGLVPVTTERFA